MCSLGSPKSAIRRSKYRKKDKTRSVGIVRDTHIHCLLNQFTHRVDLSSASQAKSKLSIAEATGNRLKAESANQPHQCSLLDFHPVLYSRISEASHFFAHILLASLIAGLFFSTFFTCFQFIFLPVFFFNASSCLCCARLHKTITKNEIQHMPVYR